MAFTTVIAALHARAGGFELMVDAPREKLTASKRTNCHLPCFNLPVACAVSAPQKFSTAPRARAATALLLQTVFKFVAIMRHHAALGKQITSVPRPSCCDVEALQVLLHATGRCVLHGSVARHGAERDARRKNKRGKILTVNTVYSR